MPPIGLRASRLLDAVSRRSMLLGFQYVVLVAALFNLPSRRPGGVFDVAASGQPEASGGRIGHFRFRVT